MCAEFAQEDVLQMLRTVLPEEISLVRLYSDLPSRAFANDLAIDLVVQQKSVTVAYVRRANDYTDWVIHCPIFSTTALCQRSPHHINKCANSP